MPDARSSVIAASSLSSRHRDRSDRMPGQQRAHPAPSVRQGRGHCRRAWRRSGVDGSARQAPASWFAAGLWPGPDFHFCLTASGRRYGCRQPAGSPARHRQQSTRAAGKSRLGGQRPRVPQPAPPSAASAATAERDVMARDAAAHHFQPRAPNQSANGAGRAAVRATPRRAQDGMAAARPMCISAARATSSCERPVPSPAAGSDGRRSARYQAPPRPR